MAARATTAAARTAAETSASAPKKAAPSRAAAKKAVPAKTVPTKTPAKKPSARGASKQTGDGDTTATTTATKPAASTRRSSSRAGARSAAAMLVKPDEKPWTSKELSALRSEIEADIGQLEQEIDNAEAELFELMHDGGDGAGDDQADAGAKTYEREQEISLANNARELLEQYRRALERMDDGSYGVCESCGSPIGKLRLQAAPRATLCMPCKMKEERR